MEKEKVEKAIKILLKEDRFYDDETEIKATKVLLKYIKELEQKESILDKVTDYIKKDIEENMLSEKCNEDGMGTYWRGCIDTEAEILNIIEGGI